MDINKYIGIPFKIHGRDFNGLDCYGLVRLFYKEEFGIELPLFLGYDNTVKSYSEKIDVSRKLLDVVRIDKPEVGSIGLFRYKGFLSHVGVYVGNNMLLHILNKTDSICVRTTNTTIKGRLEGWYKYVG
jgi:cell wall-associated NlpC family hydrolase